MDQVRELVRARLADMRISLAAASKRLGMNPAYLQQFLERGIPKELPEVVRENLSVLLGVTENDLRPVASKTSKAPVNYRRVNIPIHSQTDSRKIPVLGMAEGGPDGSYEWNGQVIEYIDAPPFLSGAIEAYAVYVTGSSMAPRYEAGELLYIHPARPVTPGCYVLVQTKNGNGDTPRAFLKRLVRRTGNKVILEQLNPRKEMELPADEVVSIHRIIGAGEP